MVNLPDYAAMGFTVTVDDAAEVLSLTRAEVLDLIRARDLPSLLLPAPTPIAPAGFRIHVDELRALAERIQNRELTVDERIRALTQSRLREYLVACPPVDDYDEAAEFGVALWGRTSGGRRTLNVFASAVRSYVESIDPQTTLTESAIAMTLQRLGGVKVRGVIPWSTPGGKQRWSAMYRIPQSLLRPHDEDETAVARDVTASQREPGEEVRRQAGSTPLVNGKPW